MKRGCGILFALLFWAALAAADQITFSFISPNGNPRNYSTSNMGDAMAGPGLNVLVGDATTGSHVFFGGIDMASTGSATSFTITPIFVFGTFSGGGTDSVSIVDPTTMFGPTGSVNMTFAQDIVKNGKLTDVTGGGTITVTETSVSLFYFGTVLLLLSAVRRRFLQSS
jgi:hypothetical protein